MNQLNEIKRRMNAPYNQIRREANKELTEQIKEERKRELAQETAEGERDIEEGMIYYE